MEINPSEYLTKEQKAIIGDALVKKILEAIKGTKVDKSKGIDISAIIKKEIREIFAADIVFENLNSKLLGNAMTDKILEAIKS